MSDGYIATAAQRAVVVRWVQIIEMLKWEGVDGLEAMKYNIRKLLGQDVYMP